MTNTLLLFVDGFGWGDHDDLTNPQVSYGGELLAVPAYRPGTGGNWQVGRDGLARPVEGLVAIPPMETTFTPSIIR